MAGNLKSQDFQSFHALNFYEDYFAVFPYVASSIARDGMRGTDKEVIKLMMSTA